MRWLRSTTIMPIAVCANRSNIDCAASFSTPSALCGSACSWAIAATVARPCWRPGHWKPAPGAVITGLQCAMVDPIPLHGTSMHDGVAARLRSMVFERELQAGAYIDEKALAARWQISRTPLREALKVLAAEGLVELVPRRGCRVIEMTDEDAEALLPVMALLEGRCAYEAVRRASDDDIAELARLHAQ